MNWKKKQEIETFMARFEILDFVKRLTNINVYKIAQTKLDNLYKRYDLKAITRDNLEDEIYIIGAYNRNEIIVESLEEIAYILQLISIPYNIIDKHIQYIVEKQELVTNKSMKVLYNVEFYIDTSVINANGFIVAVPDIVVIT